MFTFTDDERAGMAERRAIVKDPQGREILAGLSFEDTVYCMEYSRRTRAGHREHDPDRKNRYVVLMANHQRVLRFAHGAESAARKPGKGNK